MRRPESPNRSKGVTRVFVALVGILARAVFRRVYRLDQVPPGIHADEVSNGEPPRRAALACRL